MQRWHDVTEVPGDLGSSVVTIGVFDGVHRGHQRVIGEVLTRAKAAGARSVVVTLDPNPISVVRPDATPRKVASLERRLELFEELGVDGVLVLPFTKERSQQPAEEFVRELVGLLRPVAIVVGDDFRFGFKAAGDVALLTRLGTELGFEVEGITRGAGDPTWSSTAVRERLAAGDVAGAQEVLGHPFRIDGVVVRGEQRGRELGFPTANVPADAALALPVDGVYAGWLTRRDGDATPLPAAISVGTKPQFGDHELVIEAYVLDRTDLELYDVPVSIEFTERIRGQEVFGSVEELIETMNRDVDKARELLVR